jgi:hypothetical protein
MALFDWNQAIPNIPNEWRSTEGKGIKIAILDSGANLINPTLQHLDQPGHKFNVARPDYNLSTALAAGGGNDSVLDQASFGEMHGTACLSVLAGKPESSSNGIKGVAPQAEIYIIKIMDSAAMYRKGFILDAIELALKLKVDVITCAVLPSFSGTYTEGRKDVIFNQLRNSNTALVTTLINTTLTDTLVRLRFPSDQPESIVTGVAQVPVLNSNPSADLLFDKISFLTPPVRTGSYRVMAAEPYPLTTLSSSVTTTALAGVIALAMSHLQRRPNRDELIALLTDAFGQSFNTAQMIQQTAPAFYHK